MFYSASLLYRSTTPQRSSDQSLWEDSVLLIEAPSEEAARSMAEQIGKRGEHEYVSATNEHISWALVDVARGFEIGESLSPGTELFSRFLRSSEAKSLLTPF